MSKRIRYRISGMSCQSCANRLEKVLNKQQGITHASVNFASEEALIDYHSDQHSPESLAQLIDKTGFQTSLNPSAKRPPLTLSLRQKILALLTFIFALNMLAMTFYPPLMLPLWLQAILASICQLWLAHPFYKSAIAAIKAKTANMDVLVVLGSSIIYLYSLFYTLHPTTSAQAHNTHNYFEASVMIIGFISLGKFLEARYKRQSQSSLEHLLQLTPAQVRVQRQDTLQTLPLDAIEIGDQIHAIEGQRIACDGIVVNGHFWCDESPLTGESHPSEKTTGQTVLAGAMVVQGSGIYQSQALGRDTLLGETIDALATAQNSKAPIARIADRVAAVFVPLVIAFSLLTFLLTGLFSEQWQNALLNAVAVLVIACPCALGLATPTAIIVGMGKTATRGIHFKTAAALEQASQIDTLVFDKTGTLTQGKPSIQAIWLADNSPIDRQSLLAITAAAQRHANHPIASAFLQEAQRHNLSLPSLEHFQSHVGQGIEAQHPEYGTLKIGTLAFTQTTLPDTLPELWQIATIVSVSLNHQPIGAFALSDPLRPDSLNTIQKLHAMGLTLILMSGDTPTVSQHIAKQLNIDTAHGAMRPKDKAQAIENLRQNGHHVAMVGDGINDTPALASANISFAMKSQAAIAEHSADAIINQPSALVDALLIAQQTVTHIKQNLFFAFIYNLIALPLAALGYLTPALAALAMALSSLSVLANAIRLKHRHIN